MSQGKLIVRYEQKENIRAVYGEKLVSKLSKELTNELVSLLRITHYFRQGQKKIL